MQEIRLSLSASNKEEDEPPLVLRTPDSNINPEITRIVTHAADSNRHRKKIRTREKIAKLVADGAKNYPAYLKLTHTGESDFSDSDHEMERVTKSRYETKSSNVRNDSDNSGKIVSVCSEKEKGMQVDIKKTDEWIKTPETPGEEKKDSTKATPTSDTSKGERACRLR